MRLKIKKSDSYKFSKKYLELISKSRVYDVADKTPVTFATNLSSKLKNDVYLKREDMQPIFSFKIRGAYNKIANLNQEQQKGESLQRLPATMRRELQMHVKN